MQKRDRLSPQGVILFVACVCIPLFAQDATKSPGSVPSPLSVDEVAGKKLFLQRCSFCHMPQRPEPLETIGPHLEGLFQKGSQSDTEAFVRKMILNGNPGPPGRGMPGFRYGLETSQIDKIIAYLKTLRKEK